MPAARARKLQNTSWSSCDLPTSINFDIYKEKKSRYLLGQSLLQNVPMYSLAQGRISEHFEATLDPIYT